jgi:hypothetical protein
MAISMFPQYMVQLSYTYGTTVNRFFFVLFNMVSNFGIYLGQHLDGTLRVFFFFASSFDVRYLSFDVVILFAHCISLFHFINGVFSFFGSLLYITADDFMKTFLRHVTVTNCRFYHF